MAFVLSGCGSQKTQPNPGDLLGIWKTGTISTEWGNAVIEVNFASSTDVEFRYLPLSAPNGTPIVNKGKYSLNGGHLTSDVINKGSPVSIWLEGGELVIQTSGEEPMRFTHGKMNVQTNK